ncbi:hypothetical protein [Pelagibacterium lentulum]|uniref:Uncharacterized protein n=1 Tax=Pelagibacterium lentulum TaxID=2029865 RepID=A0A916VUV8_9HYPH|nr:hypothetical protein [Pelagibacterium lentulum]GGA40586.1 hypothetical protein GCM10011499_07700 [Pelagibacterium lentulum]
MTPEIVAFNYNATAELYPGKRSKRFRTLRYKRFDSAAEALRYVVEDIPRENLPGTVLEIDEQRFGPEEIAALYQDAAYPLARA